MFNDTSNINLINNLINYNIEIIDISNIDYNRIDSSRNLIMGELLNMNNNLNKILFLNLLENSLENILDNRKFIFRKFYK